MNDFPPNSVHLDRANDDHSELTMPLCFDECISHTDDFGIKLSADPYFYYTLDERHPPKNEKQEVIELKMQIARQQEKLDKLSSKLSQCQVENELLKAENNQLVNEFVVSSVEKTAARSTRFLQEGNGGSMQRLLDKNEKLTKDNARLEVLFGVMRKSFRAYIKDVRKKRPKDSPIEDLPLRKCANMPSEISFCEDTAKRTVETLDLTEVDYSQRSGSTTRIIEDELNNVTNKRAAGRRHTMPMMSNSVNDTVTKATTSRNKAEELLVDFGETRRGIRRTLWS